MCTRCDRWRVQVYNGSLQKLAGIFYRIRSKLSQTCLKAIYFAFVHCHLLYGVELYANTGIRHLSKLITLNNEILRIIQNKAYNAPVKELYTAYTTLPIPQLHKQQLLLLVHKYYYHKHLPSEIFFDYFQFNQGMYSYEEQSWSPSTHCKYNFWTEVH